MLGSILGSPYLMKLPFVIGCSGLRSIYGSLYHNHARNLGP